jgi:hypothetical protein
MHHIYRYIKSSYSFYVVGDATENLINYFSPSRLLRYVMYSADGGIEEFTERIVPNLIVQASSNVSFIAIKFADKRLFNLNFSYCDPSSWPIC